MNKNDDVWGCPYCRSTRDVDGVAIIPADDQVELFWEDVFKIITSIKTEDKDFYPEVFDLSNKSQTRTISICQEPIDMRVDVAFGSLQIGFDMGCECGDEPVYKNIKINFCPMCGRRIAEEHK